MISIFYSSLKKQMIAVILANKVTKMTRSLLILQSSVVLPVAKTHFYDLLHSFIMHTTREELSGNWQLKCLGMIKLVLI